MFVEVESNPNCESSVFIRFKEVGPARPISHIKIYDRIPRGEWCSIIGWREDVEHPECSAFAQKIEDSGAGIAILVFGGNWGVRLKPESCNDDWDLQSQEQWGEPYLSIGDERDLRYEEGTMQSAK